MSGKVNPVRLFLARVFFWLFWGPYIVVRAPFMLVALFIDWLSWRALPAIGTAWDYVEAPFDETIRFVAGKIIGDERLT